MSEYKYYSYNKPPKKRGFLSYVIVALIAAMIGGTFSAYIAPTYLYGKILPMPEIYLRDENIPENQIVITPSENQTPVTAVAKKSMSSVVGITTIQIQKELLWEREVPGVGSGVIIDSDGYILTNSHVIADGEAKSINVLFEDGNMSAAIVLWYDSALDLAILKVEERNLPVAELGNSDILEVGQLAVAIGNPLGLDFQRTVTSGIISGLNRSIRVSENNVIEDLIQTDASINFGNSGGPLLNDKGQVIGINTAKVKSGEGLGFAIPINLIKPIASQVIKEGSFSNVYIGFEGWEVDKHERYTDTKLGIEKGVVILKVIPNSPAANANLRLLDVIVKIDDEEIESMTGLRKILYNYKLGDKAILTINREGLEKKVEIQFNEFAIE